MAVIIAVLIIILAVLILSAQPRWVGRRMLTSATERVAHVKSDGCYPARS